MGRPSLFKYQSENFLEHLKDCGSVDDSAAIIGTTADVVQHWKMRVPGFQERFDLAMSQYRDTQPLALRNEAKRALANYIFGRMEKVSSSVVTKVDRAGNLIDCTETITRSPVGVPRWAIERVLGQNLSEVEALTVLANSGFLPKTLVDRVVAKLSSTKDEIRLIFAEYFPDQDVFAEAKPGLSDFAAEQIRSKILRVPSQDSEFVHTVEVNVD